MSSEKHEFKAEVSALLGLVTNSLYTNSEVFLRELISNASDALDRGRFAALVDDDVEGKDIPPQIIITADHRRGVLSIEDTGIGMSAEEASRNLGTIAHSGTLAYLEAAQKAGRADLNLIGQFGVGFYSAFMVADRVEVESRSARRGSEPVRWVSEGKGEFEVSPGTRERRGTTIELHLKPDAKDFLERYRIATIVRRFSNYVMHPILFRSIDAEGKIDDTGDKLNAASAIWARNSAELSDDDYAEFYKHVMGGFVLPGDAPLARLHFSTDAPIQFDTLLFIPGRVPQDLFQENRKSLQLFARRILVMESCDQLLPQYLRFLRGVVDSADLPLNVSREMLQENKSVAAIRRQLTRRALRLLTDLAKDDADTFAKVWVHFGAVIKEGIHVDGAQRKELVGLLRWRSVARGDALVSLEEYVAAMPTDQSCIYYITGSDEAAMRGSPHLEAVRAAGHDVLLMSDPVDEWVLQSMPDHDGKPFRSVTQGELDEPAGDDDEAVPEASPIDPLLAKAKQALGERVRSVRASKRLRETASCLVDHAGGLSRNMERILRMAQAGRPGEARTSARILELNPTHSFVLAANRLAVERPDDARLAEWIELLLDLAGLAEGEVADPVGVVRRVQSLLDTVAATA